MAITNKTIAQALEKLDKLDKATRVAATKEHFELFLTYYGREYIKYPFADFHFDFFKDAKKLAENIPYEVLWCAFRESAKTSIAKWFVIWLIASKRKKNIAILSYRDSNSSQFALDVAKELSENPLLKRDFGTIYEKARESTDITKKTAKDFECAGGIWVQSATVGIDPRGLLKGNQRPDCVILDDIENNDTIGSKVETEKIRNQIVSILGGIDFDTGTLLYLGNYLSSSGNIAWLKKKLQEQDNGRVRFIPAISEGKSAWETKFTLDKLEAKKNSIGSIMFGTEYLLVPYSDLNKIFKQEYFKYISMEDVLKEQNTVYIAIDPAFTKSDKSDYTGITINFVNLQGEWRLKAYKKKLSPHELVEEIFSLNERYKPRTIMIEDFAYTSGLKPFIDQEMRNRRMMLPLITTSYHQLAKIVNSTTNKEQRIINSLSPLYESGTIYHIGGECYDLEEQLLTFPLCENDDVIDSAAYQVAIVQKHNQITNARPVFNYPTGYNLSKI